MNLFKRIFILSVISFAGLVISCRKPATSTAMPVPASIIQAFAYNGQPMRELSVHRGGGEQPLYPENCLESFAYFQKNMRCLIECDIELSKDSVLLMMHDNSLDRTTTLSGKLIEKDWAYIRTAQLKDNFGTVTPYRIPTLEQVLDWGRGRVIFTLDVKRNTPYRKVVEMVERKKAENYSILITYDVSQAKEVYQLNPNLLISATIRTEKEYDRYRDSGIPDKNLIAFIGTREPTSSFIEFLHAKGIRTILGTLGNLDKQAKQKPALYQQWFEKGVDIISTDYPFEVHNARGAN